MNDDYDVIVIGLGAMGSAATYQLAKKGQKVLGIDQFSPPHNLGSSHGESRIIRQAIAEGEEYVPLVMRSYELWKQIEKESGKKLLTETGILIMASNTSNKPNKFLDSTKQAADRYNIKHRNLDSQEVMQQYPQFKLQGGEQAYFEDGAGFLRPELCITAQLDLARLNGAAIHTNEKFISYLSESNGVVVKTDAGQYRAKHVVLCVGPWVKELMPAQYQDAIKVFRQVLYWFEVEGDTTPYELGNFPVFNWEFNTAHEDFMYGFPIIDGSRAVKVATEQYAATTAPSGVPDRVTESEIAAMYKEYIQPHMPGLTSNCLKAESCLYTVAPEWGFVIDHHPEYKNVTIASPCSGHGFKHSAAIGEILSDLAVGQVPRVDISKFSFNHLAQAIKQT